MPHPPIGHRIEYLRRVLRAEPWQTVADLTRSAGVSGAAVHAALARGHKLGLFRRKRLRRGNGNAVPYIYACAP